MSISREGVSELELIGNGCVMAIGGNEDKRAARTSILAAFIERAGGAQARIVIVPSASVAPRERAQRYTKIFTRLGVNDIRAVHPELGVTPEDIASIRNATGIFVTGGDQVRLMEALRAADCVEPIRDAVRGGAVYAGTSAGASALSQRMIASSTRKKGADVVMYDEGLGLIPDAIIDQHFGQRRRLTRLINAANAHALTGIGIDENTAIVWNRDGIVTVEGAGEVTIVDPDHRMDVNAKSYRLQVLRPGFAERRRLAG
jgi:cyanophycinase